ncbi:hypothetical protein EV368DRAFT_65988 [Lentinula lateritia]|nr:hypothetical protein EV368DRAFT_65988 [Lentinula lateritia]
MFDLLFPLYSVFLAFMLLALTFPGVTIELPTTSTNVTIDDQDPAIFYSAGQWNLSNSYNSLDVKGFHHLSGQSSAFAVFNFTGVAIYFLSPLWPYAVGAQLVLDNQPPAFVDLQDYSRSVSLSGGSETVSSAVVWGVENLELGNHSLRVEFAQENSEYVVLDALIYSSIENATVKSPASSVSSFVGGFSTMPSPTVVEQTSSSTAVPHQSGTSAAIGAVVAVVVVLVIFVLVFLVFRYRKRKAPRFPRLDIWDGEDPAENRDQSGSVMESSATHDATVLSMRSRSAERLLQSPTKTSSTLPSVSKSAVAVSPRLPLPPINTKQLPALPTPDEETQSALKYTKSIFSAVSKRFTTPAPIPQSGSATESTTSSFFPRPIFDEDHRMLSISRQHSLRGTTTPIVNGSDALDPAKVSRIGTYPGVSTSKVELQEARSFPTKPITRNLVPYPASEKVQPPVTVEISRKKNQSPPPLPTQPSTTVSPHISSSSVSYPAKRKSLNALTIIPENSGSRGKLDTEEMNSSSNRTGKRVSGGKLRMEKERQRRRRSKTPVTPQGPRSRPLPLPPASLSVSGYHTPLPSASSGGSSNSETLSSNGSVPTVNSQISIKATVQGHTVRGRRPLPQTLPEARRSSLLLGSHILVPLRSFSRGLASVPGVDGVQSRALDISSIIQSQPERFKSAYMRQDQEPKTPSSSSDSARTEDDDDYKQELRDRNIASPSPQLEWDLPVLSSLLSLPSISLSDNALNAPSSALLPVPAPHKARPLRPRSGQLEYSRSLPSSLPSLSIILADNVDNFSPSVSTSTRGPLPPTPPAPLSARSAPETHSGDRSPRSPRRLPPEPLQLKHTRMKLFKEITDAPYAQYLTIPGDLNLAPPPYSGRRFSPSTIPQPKAPPPRLFAQEAVPLAEAEQTEQSQDPASLNSTRNFARRALQSIPATPSEWRTSPTALSLTTPGSIGQTPQHQDDTAAEMLFELLEDAGSISSTATSHTSTTIRPLSIPKKSNRMSSVPPPPRQSAMTHNNAVPPITLASSRLLSPPNTLIIPPHPITPPPPLPSLPPGSTLASADVAGSSEIPRHKVLAIYRVPYGLHSHFNNLLPKGPQTGMTGPMGSAIHTLRFYIEFEDKRFSNIDDLSFPLVDPSTYMVTTMRVVTIILVLQLFIALGHGMPKGLKGKKWNSTKFSQSSKADTQRPQREAASRTRIPSFPPSHWVNPYRNCNAEKTEIIDTWIMDAFNMTFEAEHMTRDHPAFKCFFFRDNFPTFEKMIRSLNSASLGSHRGLKYEFQCAQQCPPRSWLIGNTPSGHIRICQRMFDIDLAKLTSRPFDNSENGWCRTPPHLFWYHVPVARIFVKMMIQTRFRMQNIVAADYHEDGVNIWTAARNLKSNYTTLLAQWEQANPHQRGYPPIPPEHNTESYAASIVAPPVFTQNVAEEFFFMRKCGKVFNPDNIVWN